MSASATNQYIRQVLHHTEAPPPIAARFFYSSPIPIDDPLSALPPASSTASTTKHPPKPFSEYDNAALDKAWHALRKKIHQYNEERGEKDGTPRGVSRARKSSSVARSVERAASSSKPSTPHARPSKLGASTLSRSVEEDETEPTELDLEDDGPNEASALAAAVSNKTTGNPFARAPSKQKVETLPAPEERSSRPRMKPRDTYAWEDPSQLAEHEDTPEKGKQAQKGPTDSVAVGVSRLHQVEMPSLQMTPIYWTPVNDTADVLRGTWFYQDTMLPVETPVANMLEAGYLDLKVWTETWKDELASAIEVGAEGEMKIVHKLWPENEPLKPKDPASRPVSQRGPQRREASLSRTAATNLIDTDPQTPEKQRQRIVENACDLIDVSTGYDGPDNKAAGESHYGLKGATRTYTTCGVIYQNEREARILKPTLLPSAYYGRRPLANYISKGYQLGTPVVRGFDQQVWDKLHPPKSTPKQARAARGVTSSASGASPDARRKVDRDLAQSDRPEVTDLIFVIHGIGQKLSQRMESFNFTHAINAFRREVMVECGSKDVKPTFRPDMGGIMVLPINWRQSLSFEEGGYRDDSPGKKHPQNINEFSLDDITPDTLPSVRGIVSDVMLDVPYYMSHHQPKMIAAVIKEANRVYELWCKNNPGFSGRGRVHIIAHSLGSVMAIDILSAQPTTVPPLKPEETQPLVDTRVAEDEEAAEQTAIDKNKHLLFNTHNLFLAGSPAGFFLLLRRAQLRPRPPPSSQVTSLGTDADDAASIYGQPGAYGCIAVQNIYNLINGYDPVAYRMNAAVDARYAASLKKFFLPTNVPGYWFSPAVNAAPGPGTTTSSWFGGRPSLSAARSARELELQRHEDMAVARERMLALNDNGQIDFFIRYGGGVLEIQYLTMLGAHSAYWGLKDFIRVIVMETGRRPGREGVLGGLKAVRKKEREAKK